MSTDPPVRLSFIIAIWALLIQIAAVAMASEKSCTAFIHANLIPMTTEAVIPDQTVVVQGNQIITVGSSSQTHIPPHSTVMDCRNTFLMPGLADMHVHLPRDGVVDNWPVSPLKLYLANGVTTIRCFGPRRKKGRSDLAWRKKIAFGELAGPNILTCGPQLRGHFKENPEHIVIRQKYQHFDFIKVYSFVTREEFHSIMSTAKKIDIYVAGHIPFQVGLEGVMAEWMDEIAHIEEFLWEFSDLDRQRYFEREDDWMTYAIQMTFNRLGPLLQLSPGEQEQKITSMVAALVDKLREKPIPVCTTLVIDDGIVQKLFDPKRFLEKPENRYLPPSYLERFRMGREKHQLQFKDGEVFAPFKYLLDKKLLAALKAINTPLLLSTDAGTGGMGIVPGFSLHDELKILVENGFTPYEALASGTVVASEIVQRMNGRDAFGTIVPGKRADLLLLKENPLEDVANARKILGVMAAGRWYDQKAISEMLAIE
ncbi:amidohydrolase [Desulfosarcina widdelii]|uniref:Amidohydrolase n=1 Tax=Desulfosarcina widdelii TaxID=947919 RepID=A0A5K7ZFD4_9BACT|nr:amidohydrolase family protein [Desulfosarcina widdelii]BBO78511.1 amidohydrolase [Desulfosarcina widdelii]